MNVSIATRYFFCESGNHKFLMRYQVCVCMGNVHIRAARIVGCIEKYPGVALEIILEKAGSVAGLGGLFTDGFYELSMADGAVGFTSFDKYTQYNPDGEDIEDVVEGVEALIEVGELDADY